MEAFLRLNVLSHLNADDDKESFLSVGVLDKNNAPSVSLLPLPIFGMSSPCFIFVIFQSKIKKICDFFFSFSITFGIFDNIKKITSKISRYLWTWEVDTFTATESLSLNKMREILKFHSSRRNQPVQYNITGIVIFIFLSHKKLSTLFIYTEMVDKSLCQKFGNFMFLRQS